MHYLIGLPKSRCYSDEAFVNTDNFTRLSTTNERGRDELGRTRAVNGNRICFWGQNLQQLDESVSSEVRCLSLFRRIGFLVAGPFKQTGPASL